MRFQSQLVCTVSFGLVALTIVSKPKQREPKSSVTKHARVARERYKEETRTSTLRTLRNKEVSQVKPDLLQRVNSSYLPYARQHKHKYIIYRTLRPIYKYIYKKRVKAPKLKHKRGFTKCKRNLKTTAVTRTNVIFLFPSGDCYRFR